MLENSRMAERLAAPQEGLSSMNLAGYDIPLCKLELQSLAVRHEA
jgi:hypothetical protein